MFATEYYWDWQQQGKVKNQYSEMLIATRCKCFMYFDN